MKQIFKVVYQNVLDKTTGGLSGNWAQPRYFTDRKKQDTKLDYFGLTASFLQSYEPIAGKLEKESRHVIPEYEMLTPLVEQSF